MTRPPAWPSVSVRLKSLTAEVGEGGRCVDVNYKNNPLCRCQGSKFGLRDQTVDDSFLPSLGTQSQRFNPRFLRNSELERFYKGRENEGGRPRVSDRVGILQRGLHH